eukprot:2725759-Prymnesium_polylepis.2
MKYGLLCTDTCPVGHPVPALLFRTTSLLFRAFRATLWRAFAGTRSGGGAPPDGGLAPAVDEVLLSEFGGPGTGLNTFNTTPGNTTHGTSH